MTLVLTLLLVFTMAIAITVTEAEADEVEDYDAFNMFFLSRNKKQMPTFEKTEEQQMPSSWGKGAVALHKYIMGKSAAKKKDNCIQSKKRCSPGISVCCNGGCLPSRGSYYCT